MRRSVCNQTFLWHDPAVVVWPDAVVTSAPSRIMRCCLQPRHVGLCGAMLPDRKMARAESERRASEV